MEMNDLALKQFDFRGASVRTVTIKGEPWWVAADVCAVLEIENSRHAISRLEKDDVALADIIDSMGRRQKATVINEPGLYELLIRSDKAQARPFRRWVTKEVLPEIRRTGRYSKDVSPWLSSDPSQWRKTFPDAYFLHIFRLKGKRPPKDGNLKYTPWLAHINNDLIYKPAGQSWEPRLTRPLGTSPIRSRSSCIENSGVDVQRSLANASPDAALFFNW
jgi:prophage antirepressor-like protein